MSARRWSLLCSLLLTAALLCALPGLLAAGALRDPNRMDARLRPARTRTLTVWILRGDVDDRRLLNEACTAFEDSHEGVRVFLRAVGMQDLTSPDAVLPDVALFATGSLTTPEQWFLPLAGIEAADASGQFGGQTYAVPLWLEANVLSVPAAWLADAPTPSPTQSALFQPVTPPPSAQQGAPGGVLAAAHIPWRTLLAPGALSPGQGVALQQLLSMCPTQARSELSALASAQATAQTPQARVLTLGEHLSAVRAGAAVLACPLQPAVSDRVRYAALCRDGQDARDFLAHLLDKVQPGAAAFGLVPARNITPSGDGVTQAVLGLYAQGMALPNAFSHEAKERQSLCLDAFLRTADPVETLLRLR